MRNRRSVILFLTLIMILTGCGVKRDSNENAIENLTLNSTYKDMESFGEPDSITPVEDEAVIANKGYYVTAEYNGLTVTLSNDDTFTLTPSSSIIAITALSNAYTDSRGLNVGTSKKELMEKYSLSENDFLSGEENAAIYRIPKNTFIAHTIPDYDCFYAAVTKDHPVTLIYLIKNDCINGILLRHLTAD